MSNAYQIIEVSTGRVLSTQIQPDGFAAVVQAGQTAVLVPGGSTYGAGSFASVSSGAAFEILGDFNLSVWGTFALTLVLERSFDAGAVWVPVTYVGGASVSITAPATSTWREVERGVLYRLRCTARTSGTAEWRLGAGVNAADRWPESLWVIPWLGGGGGVNLRGGYNAATNTPAIATGGVGGVAGDVLLVTTAGTVAADGIGAVAPPDQLQNTGTVWIRAAVSAGLGSAAAEDTTDLDATGGSLTGMEVVGFSDASKAAAFDPRIPDIAFAWVDPSGVVGASIDDSGALRVPSMVATTATISGGRVENLAYTSATAAVFGTATLNGGSAAGMSSIGLLGGHALAVSDPRIPDAALSWLDSVGNVAHMMAEDGRFYFGATSGVSNSAATVTATGTPRPRTSGDIAADTANVYQFVALDATGVTDESASILSAHNSAYALGYSRLYFPVGTYNAPNLLGAGNVVFVGPGRLVGAYRKHIVPLTAPEFQLPRRNVIPSRHLSRFAQAVAAGSAVVVTVGDSTTAGGDNERTVRRRLNDAFGPAADNITLLNYGVGGAVWSSVTAANFAATGLGLQPSWWVDGLQSWMYYLTAATPDLVIWNFGQNGSTAQLATAGMREAVAAVLTFATRFGLRPDMLFQTPYAPSNVDSLKQTRSNQSRRVAVAGLTRTYARRYGYGIIDIGQTASAKRDGLDPLNSRRMRVQAAYNTAQALPYTFTQETNDFRLILQFNNGKDDLWQRGKLIIPLSATAGNQVEMERDAATGNVAVTVYAEGAPAELVTNGKFGISPLHASQNTNLNGWEWAVAGTSTVTYGTGSVTLTPDGTNAAELFASVQTLIGTVYTVGLDVATNAVSLRVATAKSGGTTNLSVTPPVGVGYSNTFTATATTTWLRISRTSAGVALVDNVTVYAAGGLVSRARNVVTFSTASTGAVIFQITVNGGDVSILSGTTSFLRASVERYGDTYTPVISLAGGGTPTVNINDLLLTEQVLYKPTMLDVEQFGPQTYATPQPADSGNGDNHMAGTGDEAVLTATYLATDFA